MSDINDASLDSHPFSSFKRFRIDILKDASIMDTGSSATNMSGLHMIALATDNR